MRRKSVLKALFGSDFNESSVTTLSLGRRYIRLWLLFAAIILLCIAYARPRWGWRILPFSGRGRDLMVLIDVSKSMLSEDVRPSRLKHAKQFVRELVASTPGNRYGLVDFAGTAFLECPMTIDKTSLFQALDELNTDSIPLGGTNLENALNKAMAAFKAAEGGYKAVILITDGDELYGDSSKVIAKLKKYKIPLFIVGIGDPTGDGLIKMTNSDGKTTLMRDSMGKLVESRLNEKHLKVLAEQTGGIYVRSTETDPGLIPIRNRIKALVPKEYSKGNCKRPIERVHYPLVAAILLLLVRLGIGERRRNSSAIVGSVVAIFLIAFFLESSVSAQTAPVKDGGVLPMVKSTDPSKVKLETEMKNVRKEQKALSPVAVYNQALELQRKNKLKEAANLYRQAVNMNKVSDEVRSKSFQNLGVISHKKGEALIRSNPNEALKVFDKAEQMYKESMRSDVSRKRVVLNQQCLLDDRRLAKLIKKRREEMKKKREQARKKTQKALNQQKKENQKKKCDQQKKKKRNEKKNQEKSEKQKSQSQKQSDKNQKSQNKKKSETNKQSKSNKNKKGDDKQKRKQDATKKQCNKSNGSGSKSDKRKSEKRNPSGSDSKAEKRETERKIDQAKKSVEDFKKSARSAHSKKDEKLADDVKRELEKAQKEHKKGKGEESEKHLKKALDKLAQASENKKSDSRDKNKKSNDKSGDEKKSKGDKSQKRNQSKNKPLPKPNQGKKKGAAKKGEKEKKIDPAQAAALLDLMANDEKKLRDAIKENQKRNAGMSKVPKDW